MRTREGVPFRRMSEEELLRIIGLKDGEGLSFRTIAERLGRNHSSVTKAYKKFKEREKETSCQDKE